MIIRPWCKKQFVALPNSLFNDRRLSAETRAMVALLLSKPRGWVLRPTPLRKLLSREGGTPVGWTKLGRMFAEATGAGYMARSQRQAHNPDGTWGAYDYFVGMPDDVLKAVKKAGVAIAPQPRDPNEGLPHAQNDFTNHKEQTLQKTNFIKAKHLPLRLPLLGATQKRNSRGQNGESTRRPSLGQEVIQHRLALRLGGGDAERGWLILGALSNGRRDTLTATERSGSLSDEEVLAVLSSFDIASAKGPNL
jgi:hypothetical protein